MSCKRCGSNDLWDDNLAWGCNKCGYLEIEGRPSFILAKDKPGLARSVDEMRNQRSVFIPKQENYDEDY